MIYLYLLVALTNHLLGHEKWAIFWAGLAVGCLFS